MASWNLILYYFHKIHSFSINPTTNYNDLKQMINTHCKINLDNYILEIYDLRFRQYIILNEEYILNLQNYLPRTSVTTLNGRIRIRQGLIRNPLSINRKRKRTISCSPENEHIIIWLDSYIDQPETNCQLKHQFSTTTMLDIARPMLDYDICIDNLIQTNRKPNHINTFNSKDDCLDFLQQIQSTRKILFIISNFFSEDIVPLIVKYAYKIYILITDRLFPYDWTSDYLSNLLIFNDSIHLLVRLIRDLAHDFIEKAEMISKSSIKQKISFLKSAKKLFNRANEIDRPSFLNTLTSINRQLELLELSDLDEDINNEKFARECDED